MVNSTDARPDAGTETALQVRPVSGRTGALILGVDAGRPLELGVIAQIREALATYKVVFLRDQSLDYNSQVAFAAQFGAPTLGHPIFENPEGKPHLRAFDSRTGIRANHWHSDLTFMPNPPVYAFLRNVTGPQAGGDTMWADGCAAFRAMPGSLQRFAMELEILHSNDCDYIDDTIDEGRRDYTARRFEAIHPAVCRHAVTSEPYLLVGGFARHVLRFDVAASRRILMLLSHYLQMPENTVRWSWRPGDLAIWDNLATQHYALYDFGGAHRLNERVTVAGPAPARYALSAEA